MAVTLGVLATLACAPAAAPRRTAQREPRWAAPVTGLSAGALVTSTNTSGPPLLLYLLGRGDEPGRVRDTLTVCQLGLSVIGALALVVDRHLGRGPARLAGGRVRARSWSLAHLAGRPLFSRLAESGRLRAGAHRRSLVAAVATGLVTALI